MKLQKRIAIWAGIISLVSLALSAGFNYFDFSYLCNVFVGLFSSGILICITAIITYFSERNKAILSLYRGCYNFMQRLNLNLTPNNEIALKEVKSNLSAMMESYNVDIYYYVCELSGLWKKSKLYKIVMAIWEASWHIYMLISEDNDQVMKFYLGDISKQDIQNYKFKYVRDDSLKHITELQKAVDDLRYHMNYYNCRKAQQGESHHAD